jgi:GntR family transcriptional regulator
MTRWLQVAGDLEAQIIAGELAPGQQLPGEFALADAYGFERGTIRRALKYLTDMGLIEGGRGKLRRVAQRKPLFIHVTRTADRVGETRAGWQLPTRGADSWLDDVRRMGRDPGEILTVETADGEVVRELLRTVDGRPHNLATWMFPAEIAAGTALEQDADIPGGSVPYLAQLGFKPTRYTVEIEPRPPTTRETGRLVIPQGVSLAVEHRAGLARGRVVFRSVTLWPGDRARLILEL